MVEPYYQDDYVTLYHGDCREIVPTLGKFDLLLTDPPYGKVKGDFDDAWTNRPAMLESCKEWLNVMVQAMEFNATLYWFAWPSLAGRIEAIIAERLQPLAHIVWKKPSSVAQKASPESLRAPMPETERILMAEQYGADNRALGESGYVAKCDELRGFVFEPLRAYIAGEWVRAGLTAQDANKATKSQMAGHYLTRIQWTLPTEQKYKQLQEYANQKGGEYLRKDYEYLRKDYEELRKDYEELRRPFNMVTGDQKTDVWEFPPNTDSYKHPTVKPLSLITYMVRLSSRPGGSILDLFAGSGTTGRAAKDLQRKCTMIELEERYCEIAANRCRQEVLPL